MDINEDTLLFDAIEFHVEYGDCGSHALRLQVNAGGKYDLRNLHALRTQIDIIIAKYEPKDSV